MTEDKVDLGKALEEKRERLMGAIRAFKEAEDASRQANSAEVRTINELNNAQAAFDAVVEAIRKAAPDRSDWKQVARRKTRRLRVPNRETPKVDASPTTEAEEG